MPKQVPEFNLEYLGWACGKKVEENRALIYEGGKQPDYHWWIYFDEFSMWSKHDMEGRNKKKVCNL